MAQSTQYETSGEQTADTILEIRNLEVSYGMQRGRARVLNDINVDIKRGETFGIVGESGSGKTMFVSSLMDAVQDPGVTRGQITYHPPDGDPIEILDLSTRELKQIRWGEIAMVYQAAMNAFNPSQDLERHFTETFEAHDVDRETGLERAREILRDLNVEPDRILDAYAHELSGGEKQRALLALALVLEPEVLLLDEPTAALDLLMQQNILRLLYRIKDEYDLTLVFISHDMPIISGIADRIAVMYSFEIVEIGDTKDVLLEPEHPYTRMMLRASLDFEIGLDEATSIKGSAPDPINVPTGCSFHPRCPIADERCEIEDPDLRSEEGGDHEVACFYPDVAVERLPLPKAATEGGRS